MKKEDLYRIIVKPKNICDACELDLKKVWVQRNYKALEELTGLNLTGKCIRCFRRLKSPISLLYHMGPICRKKFKEDYWDIRQLTISDWGEKYKELEKFKQNIKDAKSEVILESRKN